MPARGSGVARVARAVAQGDGGWADVPPSLRDAIVMALAQSSATPLRSAASASTSAVAPSCSPIAADGSTSAVYFPTATAPPPLTEEAVQTSIETFEDAAWVRDEAVRSYAEFHNNLESLHAAMRTQLRPVWKTSMQLRPSILADVRDECKLNRRDNIPDGVPITPQTAQHITLQEEILEDLEDTLQALRNTSVRFAAHFLSDEEKISMGANPAYLRAPDIDREVSLGAAAGAQRGSRSPHRAGTPRSGAAGVAAHGHVSESPVRTPPRDGKGERHRRSSINPHSEGNHAAAATSPSRRHHRHHTSSGAAAVAGLVSSKSNRHTTGSVKSTSSTSVPGAAATSSGGEDPLLEELRRQYQLRMRELSAQGEAAGASTRAPTAAAASASTAGNGQRTHHRSEQIRRTSSAAQVATPRSRSPSSSASASASTSSSGSSRSASRDTRHRQPLPPQQRLRRH